MPSAAQAGPGGGPGARRPACSLPARAAWRRSHRLAALAAGRVVREHHAQRLDRRARRARKPLRHLLLGGGEGQAAQAHVGRAARGLAGLRGAERLTRSGDVVGTPLYMSPEQIERDVNISFQSDIYSFGVVLYEVLTGRTPFQGKRIRTLLEEIRFQTPSEPKLDGGGLVSELINDLTMRCLKKNPKDRPKSFEEIIRILKEGQPLIVHS